MTFTQHILSIAAATAVLLLVLELLRKRRIRERHAIWWLLAGVGALIISIWPDILTSVSGWLGFDLPVNLVFFASLFILFFVAVQNGSELTKVESQNRVLAEEVVLIKLQVEELRKQLPKK